MKIPGFIGGSYTLDSLPADCQNCVNMYPERNESGAGQEPARLVWTPGSHRFATLPTAPVRGLWVGEGRLFAAGGSKLYEVLANGTAQLRGDIGDDASHSPVEMFPNGNQLYVVSAGAAYLDNGSGPEPILDTEGDPVTAMHGALLDTFFLAQVKADVSDPLSNRKFRISSPNNGLEWDPLDYAVKEGYPDALQRILTDHEELYLLGSQTGEVWRNEGDPDFPFQRDMSAFLQRGCGAENSPVAIAESIYMLSADAKGGPVAIRVRGFQPVRVSTHAVEQAWRQFSRWDDAIGFGWTLNGHSFWRITFPTADKTWELDCTTGIWHEVAWRDPATGLLHRHRGRCHAHVWGRHFVGDHTTGDIWEMSPDFADDDGEDIERVRTVPYIGADGMFVYYQRAELELEAGSAAVGQDEPLVYLSWSDTGGRTWSTPRAAGAGEPGDYGKRAVWRGPLGCARRRALRFSQVGQAAGSWLEGYIEAEAGLT